MARSGLILIFLATALGGVVAPAPPADGPLDERSFTFRLDTPAIEAVPAGDGFVDVRIEGFTFTSEPLALGPHTFEVRAIDSSGKEETSYGDDALGIAEGPATYTVALPIIVLAY